MSRNLESEIDEIKNQLSELKERLSGEKDFSKCGAMPEFVGRIGKTYAVRPGSDAAKILGELENDCGENGGTGRITYLGVFESGGRQSTWVREKINTDLLLQLVENRMAEKVLACVGSSERLNILLALLKEPMTVAALVEKHGYKSTGQVYHHLKPLLTADIIVEDKHSAKGTYVVQPHRVQGIIMLLAGIRDMIDVQYSEGEWGAEIHANARMVDERYMATADEAKKIIETYFLSLEPLVLKAFPPKEKKKLVILREISKQFEKGRRYDEKEINRIIKSIYGDHTTIRRYLIEYRFLERTTDGGEYWLSE